MRANSSIYLILVFFLLAGGCRKKPVPVSTPLHWAAKTGNIQRLRFRLSAGDDVNARDLNGWTALHCAAQEGRRETAEVLIANGADVTLRDNTGLTPLDEAARRKHDDIVALLRSAGKEE